MNIFKHMKLILIAFPIFVASLLSGCGGGGNPTTAASTVIKGTAAAGAPVVGYVSVRDSSTNTQPVKTNIPIQANGNYSVDVSGLTAPYAFLATGTVGGKTVSLYSAATSADVGGTINITPFTDLIIRNIAATAVDAYLSNPANMAKLTTAQLDAQRVALTTQLAPALTAMGLSNSIDLLRATFNADSTGLDRFMDVVKVTPDPLSSNVTITNILDAANTLVINTATGTPTGTLGTIGLAVSATPLDSMIATANAFSAYFATSLPSSTDPNLLALFSSIFLDDGKGSSAFLTEITSGGTSIIGLKFSNLVVDSIDTATGIAQMHFTPLNKNNEMLARDHIGGAIAWQMKKDAATGNWLMNGNQRIAHVSVRTTADRHTCNPANTACTMATNYTTGLDLEIDNKGQRAIGSAVITGPGLPVGGVTLAVQLNQTWFNITTTNANNTCVGCGGNNWNMADNEITSVLPNSVYTVKVYDNAPTPALMATYTEVVPVAPVLTTAMAGLAYPSISGMVNLAGYPSGTLTPAWTIPAGLWGDRLSVNVWQSGTNANLNIGADLSASNAASGASGMSTIVITAPATGTWTSGNYWVSSGDQYGGKVNTDYQ